MTELKVVLKMKIPKTSEMNGLIPLEFHLSQNYPNPFNEKTIIKYCVAFKTKVTIIVSDFENKLIETLVQEEKEAGTYEVEFDASTLPEGIYFYQLETKEFTYKKEMNLKRWISQG
jgi:hypothetical protein